MLNHIPLNRLLFIDIETVPLFATHSELSDEMKKLWDYRTHRYKPEETSLEDYFFEKAGVYAEFGKIICISLGFFAPHKTENEYQFRVKSLYGNDEKTILSDFIDLLKGFFPNKNTYLCGHNIIEFDVPFLCRRLIINGLNIPDIINISNKKPWEIPFIDTLKIWKFGDYRNQTSLHLLCTVLNIPTPKKNMEGSEVATVYWHENNLERIKEYCQKDVVATARLILKFKYIPSLTDHEIIFLD